MEIKIANENPLQANVKTHRRNRSEDFRVLVNSTGDAAGSNAIISIIPAHFYNVDETLGQKERARIPHHSKHLRRQQSDITLLGKTFSLDDEPPKNRSVSFGNVSVLGEKSKNKNNDCVITIESQKSEKAHSVKIKIENDESKSKALDSHVIVIDPPVAKTSNDNLKNSIMHEAQSSPDFIKRVIQQTDISPIKIPRKHHLKILRRQQSDITLLGKSFSLDESPIENLSASLENLTSSKDSISQNATESSQSQRLKLQPNTSEINKSNDSKLPESSQNKDAQIEKKEAKFYNNTSHFIDRKQLLKTQHLKFLRRQQSDISLLNKKVSFDEFMGNSKNISFGSESSDKNENSANSSSLQSVSKTHKRNSSDDYTSKYSSIKEAPSLQTIADSRNSSPETSRHIISNDESENEITKNPSQDFDANSQRKEAQVFKMATEFIDRKKLLKNQHMKFLRRQQSDISLLRKKSSFYDDIEKNNTNNKTSSRRSNEQLHHESNGRLPSQRSVSEDDLFNLGDKKKSRSSEFHGSYESVKDHLSIYDKAILNSGSPITETMSKGEKFRRSFADLWKDGGSFSSAMSSIQSIFQPKDNDSNKSEVLSRAPSIRIEKKPIRIFPWLQNRSNTCRQAPRVLRTSTSYSAFSDWKDDESERDENESLKVRNYDKTD